MAVDRASKLLRSMAAEAANGKVLPNCYSIGSNTNAHVTFASQQRRCLNLAWALKQRDRLDGNSFAIVGAGIAGVTLAVALRKLGAESVDLFDAYEEPATPQRASTQRFIHPNLFDWPTEGWDEANANLPVVNWLASRASKVRAQVFAGFVVEAFQARQIKLLPQRYVVDLKADPTSVRIESMPFSEMVSLQNHPLADKPDVSMMVPTEVRNYSSAVLCEGFLPEKRWEGALSGSYWRDSRPRWRTGSDVEIVGDGDGAITELFEASFQAVSPTSSSSRWHQEQLEDIARLVPAAERIAILDLEDELRRDSSNRDALTELPPMSPSITRLLSRVPYRTRVRLVGRSRERMLRPTSFVLNRVVASVLNNVSSERRCRPILDSAASLSRPFVSEKLLEISRRLTMTWTFCCWMCWALGANPHTAITPLVTRQRKSRTPPFSALNWKTCAFEKVSSDHPLDLGQFLILPISSNISEGPVPTRLFSISRMRW